MKTLFSVKNQLTVTSRRRSVNDRIAGVFRIDGINGEKEVLLQVVVNVGTFYSLTVPAENRAEVDALIAALEKARDSATS